MNQAGLLAGDAHGFMTPNLVHVNQHTLQNEKIM